MRRLAEDFEPDPIEAWTWVHLAQLCGTDLTRMEAVYEDGSPADDDLPGNIFAVGGIDVPDISAEQQAQSQTGSGTPVRGHPSHRAIATGQRTKQFAGTGVIQPGAGPALSPHLFAPTEGNRP
jgi:hypothetical protein